MEAIFSRFLSLPVFYIKFFGNTKIVFTACFEQIEKIVFLSRAGVNRFC